MYRFLSVFIAVIILCSGLFAEEKEGGPVLSFKNGMSYNIQETSKMPNQTMRNLWKFTVIKVFPDKSALIEFVIEKMETGPSPDALKEKTDSSMKDRKQYYLYTKNGLIYIVGGGMPGTGNEIDELKKAGDTKKWFINQQRFPMDWYKLPLKKIAINSSATRSLPGEDQKWTIKRLKDENIAGKSLEVYEAKDSTGSVTEICWYDPAEKIVIKRKMIQGADVEIEQIRM